MLPLTYYVTTLRAPPEAPYGIRAWSRSKSGFRQRKPYNVDTPYTSVYMKREWGEADPESWSGLNRFDSMKVGVTNKARERFVNSLGDASSFGATVTAEGRKTFGMVVGGIVRLARAAKHVKRLEVRKAAELLGVPVYERNRKVRVGRRRIIHQPEMRWPTSKYWVPKTAANAWLFYSYGVAPLAADIHNGLDVLTRPLPDKRFKGSAKETARAVLPNPPYTADIFEGEYSVRISAYVRVSNPNLWLANQLGLVNPAQWVNEAVPFSFVLDWISNWSQVISQMTDFEGLELTRPLTTTIYKHKESNRLGGKSITTFTRGLEIPSAKLQFAYERFGWQRGLNAISLLVGFLPKR